MKKAIFSKFLGWIILIGLVVLDAVLDIVFAKGKGLESPVWKPIAGFLGISNPIFLTPFVLAAFFAGMKILGFLIKKFDKTPKAEELVLSILVIVYGILDIWLISVYAFGFRAFKNQIYLIPILIAIGIAYGWWAENKLKKEGLRKK